MPGIRFILLFFFCAGVSQAQNTYNMWYLGDNVGLDFNTEPPSTLFDSYAKGLKNYATICDNKGEMLFYTDGITVWNKNHNTMQNGFALKGQIYDTLWGRRTMIVKQPGNHNMYYVFTIHYTASSYMDLNEGVSYALVDMDMDGGYGAVIAKNIILLPKSSGRLTGVVHRNNKDVWIAADVSGSDTMYIFKLSSSGLSKPILVKRNISISYWGEPDKVRGMGQMKFSADGRHLVYGVESTDSDSTLIQVLDFDNNTGLTGNARNIVNLPPSSISGCEVSPNGKLLYVSFGFPYGVYQIPLDSIDTAADFWKVTTKLFFNSQYIHFGHLQLGPDGKIYLATNTSDSAISVIHFPDSAGISCKPSFKELKLPRKQRSTFPSMVQSQIYYPTQIESDTFCQGDSTQLQLKYAQADSVFWDFGDGQYLRSMRMTCSHLYADSGTHAVRALVYLKTGKTSQVQKQVYVQYIKRPRLGADTILCSGDSLNLIAADASISRYLWQNGDTLSMHTASVAGPYWVEVANAHCRLRDTIQIQYGKKPLVYLGNDTAFCHRFSKILNAGSGFKDYRWNTGERTFSIAANQKGIYSVQVLDSNLCNAADTIVLDEVMKPDITQITDSQTCRFAYLSVNRQNGINYLWSNGDTGTVSKVETKGLYVVNAQHPFCSNADSIYIDSIPEYTLRLGPDTTLCAPVQLKSGLNGTYLWSTGQTSPSIYVSDPGLYWLRVQKNQCESTDSIQLRPCGEMQYFVPNAFSPNADLNNQVFKVYGSNIQSIHIQIFNAWGEQLADIEGTDPAWDGSFEGQICPQGLYLYKIQLTDFNNKKVYTGGLLQLLR